MGQILGNIGNFFSSPAFNTISKVAGLGATGAGLAGNLSLEAQRANAEKQAEANAKLTPAQLGSLVTGATQPLNAGLVQAVTNTTDANLAEMGLSQAPGLIATATSQALAPFEQQNQQTALQLVLQKLGIPLDVLRSLPANSNLSPLIALLMKSGVGSGTGTRPPGFPTTGPNPDPLSGPGDTPLPTDQPVDWSSLGINV
jgi:hypothetical protein